MKSKYIPLLSALTVPLAGWAQSPKEHPAQSDTIADQTVQEVSVVASQGIRRMKGAGIGDLMGKGELFKAACCNLGESFVNNPSVDVNYSDATTGAKQIRLLGLAGTYVQMLTENLPAFRGAAAPYALDYVPGPWMKSIQVSKGSASVRNGHESLAGQINVQYLQPEDEEKTELNLYGNTMSKIEANLTANHHFNGKLSTGFYGHSRTAGTTTTAIPTASSTSPTSDSTTFPTGGSTWAVSTSSTADSRCSTSRAREDSAPTTWRCPIPSKPISARAATKAI